MKLDATSLQELYDAFPLLRDVIFSRFKIGHAQFYALSALRTADMCQKVQECLEWITSQVEFVPAHDIIMNSEIIHGKEV
jgi:hypothetical protein